MSVRVRGYAEIVTLLPRQVNTSVLLVGVDGVEGQAVSLVLMLPYQIIYCEVRATRDELEEEVGGVIEELLLCSCGVEQGQQLGESPEGV